MATTCANMTIIKNLFDLNMGEASTKNGVHSLLVQEIANKKIARGLVANVLSIISGEMRVKFMRMQVGENIPIPRVISGDEEDMFI